MSIIGFDSFYRMAVNHSTMSESVPRVPFFKKILKKLVQAVQALCQCYTEGKKARADRFHYSDIYLSGFIFIKKWNDKRISNFKSSDKSPEGRQGGFTYTLWDIHDLTQSKEVSATDGIKLYYLRRTYDYEYKQHFGVRQVL